MDEILRHEDFADHVGKSFGFVGWHGTLRLDRIDQHPNFGWPGQTRPPFTLIFSGPYGDVLPEGEYIAIIDGEPKFAIYINPIHTYGRDRQDYQAAFN
jgi:hypothetical protein